MLKYIVKFTFWILKDNSNNITLILILNEFYNVGTGIQTSIKELCDEILKLRDSSLVVEYNPYSKDDARRLVQNRIGSPKKAKEEIGFQYNYKLTDGLNRLIEWRKEDY